jgi:hypothetical protein
MGFLDTVFLAAFAFAGRALAFAAGRFADLATGFAGLDRGAEDLGVFFAAARCAFGRAELAFGERFLTDVLAEARRAPEAVLLNPFVTELLIVLNGELYRSRI